MSYTPGPWKWQDSYELHDECRRRGLEADCENISEGRIELMNLTGEIVLRNWASYADDSGLEVSMPDARLMAAAPDLLEAAANLLAALAVEGAGPNGVTWYQLADVYGYVERLETAIAKAEGIQALP